MDPDHFHEKPGAWKFPAIPVFLFLCLMLLFPLFPHAFVLNGKDLDVCWLVRTGELIWQNRSLPPGDVFSFTHGTRPWVLYQWGFELYLGGLYRLAGLGGSWGDSSPWEQWGLSMLTTLVSTTSEGVMCLMEQRLT